MAFAREVYTATEEQEDFAINFPYLSTTHVRLFKEGVELTQGEAPAGEWTIVSGTIARMEDATEIIAGETMVVLRNSSRSARLVDYQISTLTEDDLDTDSLQAFYLVQEAIDAAAIALGLDASDLWDATSKRITEVAEPTADADAATKAYVDEVLVELGNLPASVEAEDGNVLVVTAEGAVAWAELAEAYIPDGLIDAGMLAALTITEAELATASVTGAKLEDGSVNEEHFAEEAVAGADIQAGVIDEVHFAEEAVATADIQDAAVTLAKHDATSGAEGQVLTNEEATTVVWAAAPGDTPENLSLPTSVGAGSSVAIEPTDVETRTAWRILLEGVSTDNTASNLQLQVNDNSVAVATNYVAGRNGAEGTGGSGASWELTAAIGAVGRTWSGYIDVLVMNNGNYQCEAHIVRNDGVNTSLLGYWAGSFGTGFTGFTLSVDAGSFDAGTYQILALPEKEYTYS